MTNLFTRIKNTVLADINEVLDQKEKRNPITLLNQYLRDCEKETEKVRKLMERQYALKEEFSREYRQAEDLAGKRKRQAEIASQAGENELYLFASAEHAQYEERAARLKDALNQSNQQLAELEKKYEEMKHKLKDMHIRRMELMGRENMTRAQVKMNQVLDQDISSNKSASRFQEIESYLDRLENQVNSSYYRSTIDARIAQIEKDMKKEETHSIS
ncbi:PspA/IM30 family protein [Bacillus sp. DTU_2020_1000418_1_SI_GHA_SEK_038]|uniref:PspA/IM30 family protein n=1 Tax=Bacillus sp. DTU_2020_1000418_1_SI_GHA_SEK_038 TaxID=3077585 RepID=UPI0028E5BCCA|nr:PspA/IM30 family protein [Bacillus sp. DTU_2020_1000418_1_SI_GHA_SEK_038]WNS76332.1 PspA/IM30 family protein [Bacillus sp. DTU_2020_1000418_1_SI_GHA_SEK_038]